MFHDMLEHMFHDMFTICSFNSPDLDGHRALFLDLSFWHPTCGKRAFANPVQKSHEP